MIIVLNLWKLIIKMIHFEYGAVANYQIGIIFRRTRPTTGVKRFGRQRLAGCWHNGAERRASLFTSRANLTSDTIYGSFNTMYGIDSWGKSALSRLMTSYVKPPCLGLRPRHRSLTYSAINLYITTYISRLVVIYIITWRKEVIPSYELIWTPPYELNCHAKIKTDGWPKIQTKNEK